MGSRDNDDGDPGSPPPREQDSTENTPQSISQGSQDFSSMRDYGMKRQKSSSSFKIPAKKFKFNKPSQQTASGSASGMSSDNFGGHAK